MLPPASHCLTYQQETLLVAVVGVASAIRKHMVAVARPISGKAASVSGLVHFKLMSLVGTKLTYRAQTVMSAYRIKAVMAHCPKAGEISTRGPAPCRGKLPHNKAHNCWPRTR